MLLLLNDNSEFNLTNLTSSAGGQSDSHDGSNGGGGNIEDSIIKTAAITSIVILLMIAIIVGNLMVCVTMRVERTLRRNMQNYFLISLAVADLMLAILVLPFSLINEIKGYWPLGVILCEIWLAADVLVCTASILSLCVISLDRYFSVTHPVAYNQFRTYQRVLLLIAAIWLAAFLISVPPLFGWKDERNFTVSQPACDVSTDTGYVVYSSMGSFFVPALVILVVNARLYCLTLRQVRKTYQRHIRFSPSNMLDPPTQARDRDNDVDQIDRDQDCDREPDPDPDQDADADRDPDREDGLPRNTRGVSFDCEIRISHRLSPILNIDIPEEPSTLQYDLQRKRQLHRALSRKREKKASAVIGAVIIAFFVCWAPFFTIYLLGPLDLHTPEMVFKVFFWLGYCNSCLNPIIYTVFNKNFRNALKKVICEKCSHTCCHYQDSE